MTYCVMNKKYKAIFATEKTLHSRKKKWIYQKEIRISFVVITQQYVTG